MGELSYKEKDDLKLYDSVIDKVVIDHKARTLAFHILKVISRLDREHGFTYKVSPGTLTFEGVIFSDFQYGMYWGEWSEFYRSAVLDSSELLERVKATPLKDEIKGRLRHVFLGIDNGTEYKEIDIVCSSHSLIIESKEYVLHDDFDWLYED